MWRRRSTYALPGNINNNAQFAEVRQRGNSDKIKTYDREAFFRVISRWCYLDKNWGRSLPIIHEDGSIFGTTAADFGLRGCKISRYLTDNIRKKNSLELAFNSRSCRAFVPCIFVQLKIAQLPSLPVIFQDQRLRETQDILPLGLHRKIALRPP